MEKSFSAHSFLLGPRERNNKEPFELRPIHYFEECLDAKYSFFKKYPWAFLALKWSKLIINYNVFRRNSPNY
jgi:hypothetical protein